MQFSTMQAQENKGGGGGGGSSPRSHCGSYAYAMCLHIHFCLAGLSDQKLID